jgi:serine/threonine protein kinase
MEFARAFAGTETTISTSVPQPASGLLATFELGPVIAEGRFGSEIHAGTHRALGHPVAIRTFRHAGRPDREAVRARFLREARTLQVPHPNLIHVRDFGQDAEMVYVVTDLLKGPSLEQRLAQGPLTLDELSAWLAQVLDATAALHRRGGRITGLHPGIVRLVEEGGSMSIAISSAGVHQIQDVLSTLSEETLRAQATDETELLHVAPELLTGKVASERSDLYTAGVLGYQMATGRRPYDVATVPELLGAMFEGPPPDPREWRPELPAAQAATLLRALSRDPEARFASADEMLKAWKA